MTITKTALSKVLGITVRRTGQLVESGVLAPTEKSAFDLATSVQAYVRFKSERKDSASMSAAKLRKMTADAKLAELSVGERRHQLIERDRVGDFLCKVFVEVRQKILASALQPVESDELLSDLQRLKTSPYVAEFEKPVAI